MTPGASSPLPISFRFVGILAQCLNVVGSPYLWEHLGLDRFWPEHLPPSRKGTRWDWVLQILVVYRLLVLGFDLLNFVLASDDGDRVIIGVEFELMSLFVVLPTQVVSTTKYWPVT